MCEETGPCILIIATIISVMTIVIIGIYQYRTSQKIDFKNYEYPNADQYYRGQGEPAPLQSPSE